MEKLVYALWNESGEDDRTFNARLIGPICERLSGLGAVRLQLSVVDEMVAPGMSLRYEPSPPAPCAVISFWLNAAHMRAPIERLLEGTASRIAGYAVAESTAMPNPEKPGGDFRVRGFMQAAFLFKRPDITHDEFLEIWMRDQTPISMETQNFFYHCQNIVVRALTPDAPMWDGFVEECFPLDAMTDPSAFWKGDGSEAACNTNRERDVANVARFVDLERSTVIIASAYRHGNWADPEPESPIFPG